MFIRYNETGKYWEYDSSLAKAGGGPWIILPIDASKQPQNTWIDIPFNAANFTGMGGMSFVVEAGDISTNMYMIQDKLLIWMLTLGPSVISGTLSIGVNIALPVGISVARQVQTTGQIFLPGIGWTLSFISHISGVGPLNIYKYDTATLPAAGELYMSFQIMLPLV